MLLPVILPGIHVYVVAPVAVSVELLPVQIEVGDADEATGGAGETVTANVAVLEHPLVVPVTVYVVLAVGATVTGVPVKLPGIQL